MIILCGDGKSAVSLVTQDKICLSGDSVSIALHGSGMARELACAVARLVAGSKSRYCSLYISMVTPHSVYRLQAIQSKCG